MTDREEPVHEFGDTEDVAWPIADRSSQDMYGVAREYSAALNREITYSDIPPEAWERALRALGLPEHVNRHLLTMAELHRAGRYDRLADGVERVTGRPATSIQELVSLRADEFGGRRS